jgi:hypothetical protein
MATKQENEVWNLYILYLELGDVVEWNPQAKVATFESKWSADQFKARCPPGWSVRYNNSTTNRKRSKPCLNTEQ